MILLWFGLCFVAVFIASGRGAKAPWWFLVWSFFLTPIVGIIAALVWPFEGRERMNQLASASENELKYRREEERALRNSAEDEHIKKWAGDKEE
jgi:membrane protein implicated in regulation of membrane protease activity